MSRFPTRLLYFDGNSVSRMKPWSAKPSRTVFWGQWISLENITISLVAFKDMLDGDKITTVPQISCYRHFIHGCKTLCEWALNEWTWPDFVSYIDFVSSPQRCFSCWRHYYPSDPYIMQSEVESAFWPEVLAAVRWSELYVNVPVRLVPSTVHSGAHWRHVNHVRPH